MRKLLISLILVLLFVFLVSCHTNHGSLETAETTETKDVTTTAIISSSTMATSEAVMTTTPETTDKTITTTTAVTTQTVTTSAPEKTETEIYREALGYLKAGNLYAAYDRFLLIQDYLDVEYYLSHMAFRPEKMIVQSYYSHTVYYEYDEYGKPLLEMYFYPSDQSYFLHTYSYDRKEYLIKEVKQNDSEQVVTIYSYDENYDLYSVGDSMGNATTYYYDKDGNVIKEINQDGDTIEYAYDPKGNLVFTQSTVDGEIDLKITNEYDRNGNCVKIVKEYNFGKDNQGSMITVNQYDDRGNLIQQEVEQSNGYAYNIVCEYDENGSLLKRTSEYSDGEMVIFTYKYDENGRMIESHRADQDGDDHSCYFDYDVNGNCVREIYLPHRDGYHCITYYDYDQYGNLLIKMVSDDRFTMITTYSGYQLYYNPIVDGAVG